MGKYNPCANIRAASHAMRRRFDSLDIGKPSGLTPSQCRIMGFIMDNGGRSVYQKDIEAEFNIRRSTATRLLQSMEHKDLIMREPEENDIAYGYRLLEAAKAHTPHRKGGGEKPRGAGSDKLHRKAACRGYNSGRDEGAPQRVPAHTPKRRKDRRG